MYIATKKFWEIFVGKSVKKRFLYSYEYSDKKNGEKKTRETIFPETHV